MGYFELDESGPPPIFVMSHERSGSTLLRIVLDSHSQIACPAELLLGLTTKQVVTLLENSLGEAVPELRGKEGKPAIYVEARRFLNGVMRAYAKANGKTIWCEKWPHSTKYVPALNKVFPGSKFVCLYRDCLNTVASCLEAYGRYGFPKTLEWHVTSHTDNFVRAMVVSWIEESNKLLELERAEPGRCYRIKYEDLASDPAAALPPLFEFLGVGWEPEILTRTFQQRHDGMGNHGDKSTAFKHRFETSSIGRGESITLDRLTEANIARADEVGAALGYEPLVGRRTKRPSAEQQTKKRTVVQEALDIFITKVFKEQIPATIQSNASNLAGFQGVIRFIIPDGKPRFWVVKFKGGEAEVKPGDGEADLTVRVAQGPFLEIAAKRTTLLEGYRDGTLTAEGGRDGRANLIGLLGYFF